MAMAVSGGRGRHRLLAVPPARRGPYCCYTAWRDHAGLLPLHTPGRRRRGRGRPAGLRPFRLLTEPHSVVGYADAVEASASALRPARGHRSSGTRWARTIRSRYRPAPGPRPRGRDDQPGSPRPRAPAHPPAPRLLPGRDGAPRPRWPGVWHVQPAGAFYLARNRALIMSREPRHPGGAVLVETTGRRPASRPGRLGELPDAARHPVRRAGRPG